MTNIAPRTLLRYCSIFSDEEINSRTLNSDTVVGNKKTRQIFDKEEEVLLEAYIKAASDIYILSSHCMTYENWLSVMASV